MKIKKGFLLRKMGKEYIVVTVGAASREFNGMITINESGAFLWNELKEDISKDALVEKLMTHFPGLDSQTAEDDLDEFLDSIKMAVED